MTDSVPATGVLRQLVERARTLYSLPNVALRVLELTSKPQVDVRALKECLEHDPALVAKILRVVNSSLFGASRKISDLNQALALLGVKPLKLLVLGFSLPRELWSGVEAQVLARYWRRSLVKAVAAREFSERLWLMPGDEAFLAGLLQDVGMLVLIQDLGESYTNFLDRVHGERGNLASLETATLGFDHAVLSARLLAHWGLPEPLVRAVGLPADAGRLAALPRNERALPQVLHLSKLIATLLVDDQPAALPELLDAGAMYRDLTLEQFSAMLETLEAKVAELADVLSLELPAGASFIDVIARAHAQLSEAAAEAATGAPRCESPEVALWRETESLQASLAETARLGGGAKANISGGRTSPANVQVATDPGLLGRVAAGIASCRSLRRSFSLLLVELDRFGDLVLTRGARGAAELAAKLETLLATVCEPADARVPLGDGRVALLLEGRDRARAAELAREIMRRWSVHIAGKQPAGGSVTLSAGLATLALPSKNFPEQELLSAAERCLSAAQRCGGESLKSIEL